MSVACIDSDTSTAITTVARSRGTRTSVLGTASETTSVARPSATTPKARCRRQPGPLGHERAEQRDVGEPRGVGLPAQLQHARRRRPAPRRRAAPAATAGTGRSSGGPSAAGAPAVGDEADDVHQPVAVGAQPQVAGPGPAQRRGDLRALGGRALGEPARGTPRCRSAPPASARSPGRRRSAARRRAAPARAGRRPRWPAGRAGPTARAAGAPSRCRRGSRRSPRPARAGAAAGAASPARRPGRRGGRRSARGVATTERSSRSAASRPGIAG